MCMAITSAEDVNGVLGIVVTVRQHRKNILKTQKFKQHIVRSKKNVVNNTADTAGLVLWKKLQALIWTFPKLLQSGSF